MTCEEHYFENLLFHGKDTIHENIISKENQKIIKMCADYVIYSLFYNRDNFYNFLKKRDNE